MRTPDPNREDAQSAGRSAQEAPSQAHNPSPAPPDETDAAGAAPDMPEGATGKPYKVGYGRPPLHTRFKPKQSGCASGRPKGARGFKTDRDHVLDLPVKAQEGGRRSRKITTQRAALLALRAKALKGDTKAIDRLLELAMEREAEAEARAHAQRAGEIAQEDREMIARALKRLSPPTSGDEE